MPITPLHPGPGAVIKLAVGRRMSLMVFAFGQVLMDLEVVARVLCGARPLHGFTNTVVGATVVVLPTVLLGLPACQAIPAWWNSHLSPGQAAWGGGLLGVYPHVFLDAIRHADARPWAPFSPQNQSWIC